MSVLYPPHPRVVVAKGVAIGLMVSLLLLVGIDAWRSGVFDLGGQNQDNPLLRPTVDIQPAREELSALDDASFEIPVFIRPRDLEEHKPLTPANTGMPEPPSFEFPSFDCGPPAEPGV